jgi:choline dehydrogenase-like flavoprotein
VCQAIIEAGEELGLEYRADVNNLPPVTGDSIGWCQQTRGGRRRASAARTYLRPASKRPNLRIVTKTLVHRVGYRRATRKYMLTSRFTAYDPKRRRPDIPPRTSSNAERDPLFAVHLAD